jgi:hypothetical protein
MRKIILFTLLLSVVLIGCEKDKPKDQVEDLPLSLLLSEDTVVFQGNEFKSLFVSMQPVGECSFRVISHPEWIIVAQESQYINKNIAEVRLFSNLEDKAPGIYEGPLEIMSTIGNKTVFLRAIVGEQYITELPDSLNFSIAQNTTNLVISNKGNATINYSLSASNNYITIPQTTGSIAPLQSGIVEINANREGMQTGTYLSQINVTVNDVVYEVVVTIKHLVENKIFLSTDVVDAEYNKMKDIMVYVSSSPSAVNIYHCSTGNIDQITLDFTPSCISITPDGETAVAGHDGHISYIDLETHSVTRTYSVSCDAIDIVSAPNHWAYVFPRQDQWAEVLCVDLNMPYDNETPSQSWSIYAGTLARMHPSGKYIYGADNGLSPSDVEKYDIQNGALSYMYDSPYHGDYGMGGNLWFSEDGARIFTRGRTVLKTSEVQSLDMLYNGTIPVDNYSRIMWLDHSSAKNNLYIILSGESYYDDSNKPFIFVHNATNLTAKSSIALEQFIVVDNNGNGSYYDAEPYFVFSNSTGNKIYVLTKAVGSGLVNEWAVQEFNIN